MGLEFLITHINLICPSGYVMLPFLESLLVVTWEIFFLLRGLKAAGIYGITFKSPNGLHRHLINTICFDIVC